MNSNITGNITGNITPEPITWSSNITLEPIKKQKIASIGGILSSSCNILFSLIIIILLVLLIRKK